MTTVSFNVTEEVKNTFNEMFRGRNQNAIISNLMMRAIEEEKMKRKRVQAINALLVLRQSISPVTTQEIFVPTLQRSSLVTSI